MQQDLAKHSHVINQSVIPAPQSSCASIHLTWLQFVARRQRRDLGQQHPAGGALSSLEAIRARRFSGAVSLNMSPLPTIMIAECDEDERCLLKSILELKGFIVLEAGDGQQAFDLALQKHPDLILIDLKLPVISGFTVIRRMQKLARLRHTPIIAVSLDKPLCHRHLALAAGCAAHLNKPIEFEELNSLIDQLLPGAAVELASAFVH